MSWGLALILLFILPLLGQILFFANFFTRRTRTITLTPAAGGQKVLVRGNSVNRELTMADIYHGRLPIPTSNWFKASLWGMGLAILACGGLVALVMAFGESTGPEYAVGDNVYLVSPEFELCVDVHVSASGLSATRSYPRGLAVTIQTVDERLTETWYQLKDANGNSIGWTLERNLSRRPPAFSTQSGICQ
jgi:hypothetical protein